MESIQEACASRDTRYGTEETTINVTDFKLLISDRIDNKEDAEEDVAKVALEQRNLNIGMQMLVARRYVVLVLAPMLLFLLVSTFVLGLCAFLGPYTYISDKTSYRNGIIGGACGAAGVYIIFLSAIVLGILISPSESSLRNSGLRFKIFIVTKEGMMRFFISMVLLVAVIILLAPLTIIFFCCLFLRFASEGFRLRRFDIRNCICRSYLDCFNFCCDFGRCGDCGCSSITLSKCFCCLTTDIQDLAGRWKIFECTGVFWYLFYCLYCTTNKDQVLNIEEQERLSIITRSSL